jgi:N-acetyl-gamma-glutamyl-phosphate reductase
VIAASILGATGFTGALLTEMLDRHPEVALEALTSSSYEGRRVTDVFPHSRVAAAYVAYAPDRVAGSDVVFVCYPHAEAHPVVAELLAAGHRVVDLSADFRLRDASLYPKWYQFDHPRADLLTEAVYGLPELYPEAIAQARLVANPGCYPTSMLLAALPLAREMKLELVVVDSKSGVSGAGRTPSDKTHFSAVHDNFRAYGEVGHRHTAEMLQELETAAGASVPVSFTPHLLPLDRGILSTLYCRPSASQGTFEIPPEDEVRALFVRDYSAEPFVEVVEHTPSLREVQRTNYCRLAVRTDPAAGLIKVVSVIDNLVKGASGQAVQNMNLMFGLPQASGLESVV